jgi:hypothetical protein
LLTITFTFAVPAGYTGQPFYYDSARSAITNITVGAGKTIGADLTVPGVLTINSGNASNVVNGDEIIVEVTYYVDIDVGYGIYGQYTGSATHTFTITVQD